MERLGKGEPIPDSLKKELTAQVEAEESALAQLAAIVRSRSK
jgi:hypothetical protein